jgi:hypothetical protein
MKSRRRTLASDAHATTLTNYLVARSWPMAEASGTTLVNEIARLSVNARRLYGLKYGN